MAFERFLLWLAGRRALSEAGPHPAAARPGSFESTPSVPCEPLHELYEAMIAASSGQLWQLTSAEGQNLLVLYEVKEQLARFAFPPQRRA